MSKKANIILPYVLVVILINLLIGQISKAEQMVPYEAYADMVDQVKSQFEPAGFLGISDGSDALYSKITSYPHSVWTSETNNSYKGDTQKPRQIESFFIHETNKTFMTKVTFFYAPDSLGRDYLKADNFDRLSDEVIEVYKDLRVDPQIEVGFKGKGYYAYVQTAYLESLDKNAVIDPNNLEAISSNSDMVRQLQNFLIQKDY